MGKTEVLIQQLYRLPHKNFEAVYGFKSNSKKAKKAKFNALALLIALEYEDKTS